MTRAIEVIESGGVEALSLRALARDLTVSHAAPARHFRSKADLLTALVTEGYLRLIDATRQAADNVPYDPVQRIKAMTRGYVRWAIENPAFNRVMRNPDVTRHADENLRAALQQFSDEQLLAIRAAQSTGWKSTEDAQRMLLGTVAIAIGTTTLLTDPLFREIIAATDDPDIIDTIIEPFV